MTEDVYIIAITALLPLTACMLVAQVNPYHALVIRGILGAVAALVYALFGAADVALTEALVGTMLSITLYAVAVRSSMSMRLGVLASPAEPVLSALRNTLRKYHMRLEPVTYDSRQALQRALMTREIHTTLQPPLSNISSAPLSEPSDHAELGSASISQKPISQKPISQEPSKQEQSVYHLQTRVQRLYDIMRAELPPSITQLTYMSVDSVGDASSQANRGANPASQPMEQKS
ncbi:MAG: DUF4040 domain-containing protein [Cyanobacteria bacterium P01_A01_bin.114]